MLPRHDDGSGERGASLGRVRTLWTLTDEAEVGRRAIDALMDENVRHHWYQREGAIVRRATAGYLVIA